MRLQRHTSALEARERTGRLFATLLMAMTFGAYYLPAGYAVSPGIFNAWRAVIIGISAITLLLYLAKCKISLRWAVLIFFLLAYYLLSTALAHSDGSSFQILFNIVRIGGFVTLLEYGLSTDKNLCLKAFLVAGIVMCAVHYGTYLRYHDLPYGMREAASASVGEISRQHWFFLTHDNGSVFYFLPLLTCAWYYAISRTRGYWIPVLLSIFTLFMYWSLWAVTAMVAVTFAVALFVIIWKTDCSKIRYYMTYRRALIIGVTFCLVVLIFYSSDLMSNVANYFGKSGDLGRGRIWMRAIPIFTEWPLFGVGFESDITTTLRLGINHCHNILIQILYTGGITALALGALWISSCETKQDRAGGMITKEQCILCISIIVFFVTATFDWYLYMPAQFFPFVLYAYSTCDDIRDNASPIDRVEPPNSPIVISNWGPYDGNHKGIRRFQ